MHCCFGIWTDSFFSLFGSCVALESKDALVEWSGRRTTIVFFLSLNAEKRADQALIPKTAGVPAAVPLTAWPRSINRLPSIEWMLLPISRRDSLFGFLNTTHNKLPSSYCSLIGTTKGPGGNVKVSSWNFGDLLFSRGALFVILFFVCGTAAAFALNWASMFRMQFSLLL